MSSSEKILELLPPRSKILEDLDRAIQESIRKTFAGFQMKFSDRVIRAEYPQQELATVYKERDIILQAISANPNTRVAIVFGRGRQQRAKDLLSDVKRAIVNDFQYTELCPEHPLECWGDTAIAVRRESPMKEPTVRVVWPLSTVCGHIDLLVIDDYVNSVSSPHGSASWHSWFAGVKDRLTPGARIYCEGAEILQEGDPVGLDSNGGLVPLMIGHMEEEDRLVREPVGIIEEICEDLGANSGGDKSGYAAVGDRIVPWDGLLIGVPCALCNGTKEVAALFMGGVKPCPRCVK